MSRQGAGTAVPAPLAYPGGCVAPLVFRASEGPAAGPGCLVCPWAAARPRAVRAASFARRVASKPGQAPPPPTGTAARPCRHPPAPRPCPPVPPAPRLEARPGPATAHGHRSLALPPPTGAAAISRETVIAFAGVCSVSGETDDTIAGQIHLVLLLFHRAKASWVSWRRPEVPALVLTVSSRGAVSSMGATKFAQRRLSLAIARKYSPSAGKMA